MQFYTKKRRAPAINIVSMIDILAILLIFFIVTTTFRKNQARLQINLPDAKSAETTAADNKQPIVLRVKSAEEITLDDTSVRIDKLELALIEARRKNSSRSIALQADREAPFGIVVKVLDALKAAGIKDVPAFTQPEKP
jgi:biopolymer transport protein ExbD